MPLIGIYALTATGVLLALLAPLEIAFAAVLGAWLIIPAGLIVPGVLHIFLLDRVVLGAFALRLVLRHRQPGEPTAAAYRPTVLHAAWAVLLLVSFLDGVLLPSGSMHNSIVLWWLTLVDCAVLFVVSLAVLRTVGVWRVLRFLSLVAGVAVGIGVVERITGRGWAAYLSEHIPAQYLSTFVFGLGTRGGAVRVQAASEFALEYGWVLAMLLPLMAVAVVTWVGRYRRHAHSWPRLLLVLLPVGALADVVMTQSRSAEIAAAAGLVLLVVAAGTSKRLAAAVGAAAAIVVAVLVAVPSVFLHSFNTANPNSIHSRVARLHILFSLVAHHPFLGVGYTGLTGLIGLDDGYAITYGQMGILGLLAWLGVLLAAGSVAVRALRAPRSSGLRQLGAACAVGIAAVVVACAAYDLTFTEQSMWTFVLLGALATVLAEQVPARARSVRPVARMLWPVAGAAAGAVVLVMAPVSFARSYSVYLVSPAQLATQSESLYSWTALELDTTTCGYLEAQPVLPGTALNCSRPGDFERSAWQAQVLVEVAGPSPRAVTGEARRALGGFERLRYPKVVPDSSVQSGRPAWATTAPVSGAFAGLVLGMVVPPWRRRRQAAATTARARAPTPSLAT